MCNGALAALDHTDDDDKCALATLVHTDDANKCSLDALVHTDDADKRGLATLDHTMGQSSLFTFRAADAALSPACSSLQRGHR